MEKRKVELINGTKVEGEYFTKNDYDKLIELFNQWMEMNRLIKSLSSNARSINVPDIVSEGLYCYLFNAVRTNDDPNAGSYDAVSIKTGRGIQIKSSSISEDLTSFGPKSKWDDLVFMDFAPGGKVDGHIDIYEIKQNLNSMIMNASKNETFVQQQKEGRRPRLSIKKSIIEPNKLKPIKTINIKNK